MKQTRRKFFTDSAQGLLSFALISLIAEKKLFAEAGSLSDWFHQLNETCETLKRGAIRPTEWQALMDKIYGNVNLPELLANLDFDRIQSSFDWGGAGEKFIDVRFNIPGLPEHYVMETKIAGIRKGRSIYPHGHSNMVSAFLTIKGDFHLRQYDRVDETATHMFIRQTKDMTSQVGTWSSISDQKNNVHWLTATASDSFLFSTKIDKLNPNQVTRGRIPIDPNGINMGSGIVKAEKISFDRAKEVFG